MMREFRDGFYAAYGGSFTEAIAEAMGVIARWFTQGAMMALGAYTALSYVGFLK